MGCAFLPCTRILAALAILCSFPAAQAQVQPDSKPEFSLMRVTSLPHTIQMHGSAIVASRLYVFGGEIMGEGYSSRVFSSEISLDGQLSAWREERAMPERRAYIGNSVEVVDNRIYIVGGSVADGPFTAENALSSARDALWTSVNSDGSLSEWRRSAPFPSQAHTCAASCSSDLGLFLSAGLTKGGVVSDLVLSARFAPDGSIEGWKEAGRIPTPLWFHGSSLQDGRIYVWGGLPTRENDTLNARVFSAPVSVQGTLGEWRQEAEMPSPLYSSAFKGCNEYLLSIAGRYKHGYPTSSIWYARLKNGHVEEWKLLKTDLETRVYSSVAMDRVRGFVYVTGGRYRPALNSNMGHSLDVVQAFRIEQPAEKRLPSLSGILASGSAASSGEGTIRELTSFPSVRQALSEAQKTKRKVLAVFYSPEVPGVRRMRDNVLAQPEFAALTSEFLTAGADVSGADSELTYKFSVFQVPTMLLLSPDGTVLKKSSRIESLDEFKNFLKAP